jgi:hypothetical protein
MVYNIQNYWSSELCPLSGKLVNATIQNWISFVFGVGRKMHTLLGYLEMNNNNHGTGGWLFLRDLT